MVNSVRDLINNFDFKEIHNIFLSNNYYQILFPFLLTYALLITVLAKIKIFQNKEGKPINAIIVPVSLVVSFYGVSFEISEGHTLGSLMMVLFPNISTLTMGILALYIVGSLFNKNMFKNMFREDVSSYAYFAAGAIGLGAVIFYVGIAMGAWDYNPLDTNSYWNVILALGFLIMGVVFLIIELYTMGFVFLLVFAAFVFNSGQDDILSYFIDPVVFMVFIILGLISWLGSTPEQEKNDLRRKIKEADLRLNGKKIDDSRIDQIIDITNKSNKKKWEKLYGNEKW